MKHYHLHSFVSYLSESALKPILAEIEPLLSRGEAHEKEGTTKGTSLSGLEHTYDEGLKEKLHRLLSLPENISCLFRFLSGYEREVLEYFIFQVGQDFLTYRQIEQGLNGIQPHIFRLGLTGLRRKGIIFTVRRQWGEVAYILPADVEALFYSVIMKDEGIFDEAKGRQSIPSSEEITVCREDRPPFFSDLFFLLDEIRTQPHAEIPLTQKGTIHKRYIRSWQEKITNRESDLGACSLSIEHRDTYTNQLAILLDFLSRKNMINWMEGSLSLNLKKTEEWMSLSRQEMSEQFIAYWFTYFTSSVPWIQRYQKDMYLHDREGDAWVSLLAFVENWEERYQLPSIDLIKKQLKEEIFQPLAAFGVIEWGETEHENVWRWVCAMETLPDLWIQPTMELYCSGGIPFSDLWKVTNIFRLDQWENMLILKISKNKVTSFIERGNSIPMWLEEIRSLSKATIPQGIVDQLIQWEKSQQQVTISDRTVVEIKDVQLAKAFLQWPEVEDLYIEKISESFFLISVRDRNAIDSLFLKKGIQVKGNKEPNLEKSQLQTQINPSLIKFVQDTNIQYKVESIFPELTEAIPAWTSLPPMWTKQFSSYHEQTKRKIIEQAVQHHLMLKMEVESGEVKVISPMKCTVEQGNWVCFDQDKTKYKVTYMNRVQLLFPEIYHS